MAAEESMDIDMDIVVDVEPEMDEDIARMQAEINEINTRRPAAASDVDAMVGLEEQPAEGEEGEIAHTAVVDTKVHVRGVNDLTSRDVENFAADNFSTEQFLKIEWVDDTSVNLVYGSAAAARDALAALAAETTSDDPLELRRAKALATHPHIELFVRMAVESDRKKRGAARESEFYRLNPQHKKRRYHEPDRSHARAAYEDGRASYRDSAPDPEFSADLYDDAATTAKPARGDLFADRGAPSRRGARARAGHDLFADRAPAISRIRPRSASPTRDGDGRYGFDDPASLSRAARRRSPHFRRPNSSRRDRSASSTSSNNYASRDSLRNELFPQKTGAGARPSALAGTAVADRRPVANGAVELFPQRQVSGGGEDARMSSDDPRELFPDKATHRRQDAKDLHPDEVANAIGHPTDHPPRTKPRELFPRGNENSRTARNGAGRSNAAGDLITASSTASGRHRLARAASFDGAAEGHRLGGREEGGGNGRGFSIKGAGASGRLGRGDGEEEEDGRGFSIMGASRGGGGGGGGRDLFEGVRIKGRGGVLSGR